MPVRIRTKTRYQGYVTPSDINVETTIIELSDQPDDYIVEGCISLQNMSAEDLTTVRTYIAVDGTNQMKVDEMLFAGPQDIPVVRIPATTIAYNGKFKVTVTQHSGTVKSYPYNFIVQVMEVL